MNSRTAIFDAFGTVVRIGYRTNPYRQLLREGIKQGRRPHLGDAHLIMTMNLDLQDVAEHLGIHSSQSRMDEIETACKPRSTPSKHVLTRSKQSPCFRSMARQ